MKQTIYNKVRSGAGRMLRASVGRWTGAACALLLAPSLQAQDEVYTLKSCIENGLRNNYSLQISRNEQKVSANNATLGNAGFLPTLDFTAGYNGSIDNTRSKSRATGETTKTTGVFDQSVNVGLNLNWTLFDGFNISTTYRQLKELKRQGETNARMAVEDFIAELSAEYYNFVQQKIRLKNFKYTMSLSKDRMRIVEERYHIGNFSRLDYQQAQVDFNADSAQYMKQQELLYTSRIKLNELMGNTDVNQLVEISDTLIDVHSDLEWEQLWEATLANNASLLKADQNTNIAQMDYKKVLSRNYPYVKLNTGYGYTFNRYDISSTRTNGNLGFNAGFTVGFNIFDGNRRREKRNAALAVENARLQRNDVELKLRSDLSNLWQSYKNNLELLKLERQNLIVARDYFDKARDSYIFGSLSGIEVREAQKSLLDAEERILSAEYDTKLCEISLLQISGKILQYMMR